MKRPMGECEALETRHGGKPLVSKDKGRGGRTGCTGAVVTREGEKM